MDKLRQTLYKFFELPFHQRIEIAKGLEVFEKTDLELEQIKATQKWGKIIKSNGLVGELNERIKWIS